MFHYAQLTSEFKCFVSFGAYIWRWICHMKINFIWTPNNDAFTYLLCCKSSWYFHLYTLPTKSLVYNIASKFHSNTYVEAFFFLIWIDHNNCIVLFSFLFQKGEIWYLEIYIANMSYELTRTDKIPRKC